MDATTPQSLLRASPWRLDRWLAFGLGSGLSPVAPGTAGTLVALLCYMLFVKLGHDVYLLMSCVGVALGPCLCGSAAKALGEHDHQSIVWDEMVGYWCTMLWIPQGWLWAVVGFALFRLFDITKPWPIRAADRHIQGGWGVMFDDLLAALAANLCLQLVVYLAIFV